MQREKRSFWGTGQGDHHVATLHHCCTDRHKNTNLAKAIRQDSGSRDNAARPGQDAQTTARTARRAGQGARPTTKGAWHFWPPEVRPRPKATGNSAKSTEHLVHLCISSKSLVSIQTGHLDFEVWRSEERGLLVQWSKPQRNTSFAETEHLGGSNKTMIFAMARWRFPSQPMESLQVCNVFLNRCVFPAKASCARTASTSLHSASQSLTSFGIATISIGTVSIGLASLAMCQICLLSSS